MSNTVDNRIVSLQFDNKKFEENASESMSTLDKLKEKLQFKGATKGLEEVSYAVEKTDMSPLSNAVETVTEKFSALKVMAVGALLNIGSKASDMAINLAKSLSVDQLSAGFQKYGEKTQSVQTIVNAIGGEFENTAEKVKYVSEQLDKLNWFTDETSYSFTDMVSNVGKFTANNIDLDVAIDAMQGIATWAGISGANVQEASRAMYNMSQAIGVGAVKLQDWKSIENANMATSKFKETVLETAVAEKQLTKVSDGVYKTLKGHEVTVESFNANLSDAWFTSDVLLKTLDKYGGAATKLNEVMQNLDLDTTSELLDFLDEYKEGTLKIDEAAKQAGVSSEEFKNILEELSKEEYALGIEAFRAAQEAKTFQEAIDSVKDAVSTGWMQTFEYIFGNYEEAKHLWTDLANELWEVFNGGAEARNKLFSVWHDDGGRDALIESFWNVFHALTDIIDTVKDAFREIFPPITAERLIELTKGLRDLTEKFKMSEETAEKVKNTFKGLFAILHMGKEFIFAVASGLKPLISLFSKLLGGVTGASGGLGEWLVKLDESITKNETFKKIVEKVVSFLEKIPQTINDIFKKITGSSVGDAFTKLGDKMSSFKEKAQKALSVFKGKEDTGISKTLDKAKARAEIYGSALDNVSKKTEKAKTATSGFQKFLEGIRSLGEKLAPVFSKIGEGIGKFFSGLGDSIKAISENLDLTKIMKLVQGGVFASLGISIKKFIDSLTKSKKAAKESKGISQILKDWADSLKGVFSSLSETLGEFKKSIKVNELLKIAIAIGILSGSIYLLSKIEPEKLASALGALTIEVGELMAALLLFTKMAGKTGLSGMKKLSSSLLIFSVAVLIMSFALKNLSSLDLEEVLTGSLGITIIVGVLVAASKLLARNTAGMIKGAFSMILLAVAVRLLVKPIKELGSLDWESLAKGLLGVAATCGILIASLKLMGSSSASLKSALSFVILAFAVRLIAKPLQELGKMSWEEIAKSLAAMGGALTIMSVIVGLLGKFSPASILGAFSIVVMALALKMIVSPMQALGSMNWEEIARAVVAMLGAFVIMGAVAGVLAKLSPGSILGAITMVVMALALKMIVEPMKILGSMNWDEIARAIVAMLGAFVIMGVVAGLLGAFSPASVLGAVSMVVMALALKMIVEPMRALGSMNWDEIAVAIVAMLAAMTIMGGISALVGVLAGPVLAGAIAIGTVAKALDTSIKPLKELSQMSWDEIKNGLTAMSGVLSVLAGATLGINIFAKQKAEAYKDMAFALAAIVIPMKKLSQMNYVEIRTSLDNMKIIFEKMNEVLGKFQFSDLFSGIKAESFLTFSEAIKNMSPGIKILSKEDPEAVATVLGTIGEAFKNFSSALESAPFLFSNSRAEGIGALVGNIDDLAEVLPSFLALGDFNKVESALDILAAGFTKFAESLSSAPWWGSSDRAEGIGALVTNIETLTNVLPAFMEIQGSDIKGTMTDLGDGFKTFGEALKSSPLWDAEDRAAAIATVSESIKPMVSGLKSFMELNATKHKIYESIATIKNFMLAIGTAIKEFPTNDAKIKTFLSASDSINKVLPVIIPHLLDAQKLDVNAITENLSVSAKAVVDFCESLSEKNVSIDDFEETATDAGNAFVDAFIKAIKKRETEIRQVVIDILLAIEDDTRNHRYKLESAGQYIIDGLAGGIKKNGYKAINAAKEIAKSVVDVTYRAYQVSSPSKVFAEIGRYLDLGLISGLEQYSYKVITASKNVVNDAIGAANDTINGYSGIFEVDNGLTMTITPVLDLTELYNGRVGFMNALGGMQDMGVNTSLSLAAQSAAAMNARRNATEDANAAAMEKMTGLIRDLVNNPPSVNHNEFNITNGDPEEVAEEVSQILQRDITRRNAVWQ